MIKAHTPGVLKGADFLIHVDPKQLAAQGVEVVCMYLKNTSLGQVKSYHDAGLSVLMIHQSGYEGKGPNPYEDGKRHGLQATAQAQALGYPRDLPIIFASMGDYDNTAATLPGSSAYWRGVRETCGYPTGAYGDYDLLSAVQSTSVLSVQAAAKAWSFDWVRMRWRGVHPSASMEQLPSKSVAVQRYPWDGVRVDPLHLHKPIKAWSKDIPVVLVKVPKPTLRRTFTSPIRSDKQVTFLQQQMAYPWGWYRGPLDGKFGPQTEAAVKKMQAAVKLPQDGVYGPKTAAAWQKFLTAMQAIAAAK